MPSNTSNYNLITYDRTGDTSELFIDYRDDQAGTGLSNMSKIDTQMKINSNTINTKTNFYDTIGTDTYTLSTDGDFQLVDGIQLNVNFINANTTYATINADGSGAKTVKYSDTLESVGKNVLYGYKQLIFDITSDAYLLKREGSRYIENTETDSTFTTGNAQTADVKGFADAVLKGQTLVNTIIDGQLTDGLDHWDELNGTAVVGTDSIVITGIGGSSIALTNESTECKPVVIGNSRLYKIRARVNGTGFTNLRISIDGTTAGTIQAITQLSPVDGQWYDIYGLLEQQSDFTGDLSITITTFIPDNTGKSLEIDTNIGISAIEDDGTFTAEQLNSFANQSYIDGIQSVENPTLKSIGANLQDEVLEYGSIEATTGLDLSDGDTDKLRSVNYTELKPSTGYYIKTDGSENTTSLRIIEYDTDKNFVRSLAFTAGGGAFLTSSETKYIRFRVEYATDVLLTKEFMLSFGMAIVDYIPYKETIQTAYTPLRSVPTAYDEVDMSNGELTKRVGELDITIDSGLTTYSDGFGANSDLSRMGLYDVVASIGVKSGIEYGAIGFDGVGYYETRISTVNLVGFGFVINTIQDDWFIYIPTSELNSADEEGFLSYITKNPIKAYYELADEEVTTVSVEGNYEAIPNGTTYSTSDTFNAEVDISYPINVSSQVQSNTDKVNRVNDLINADPIYQRIEGVLASMLDAPYSRGLSTVELLGITMVNSYDNGDVAASLVSDSSNTSIGNYTDGTWLFLSGYSLTAQTFPVVSGQEYFLYTKLKATSVGRLKDGPYIRYPDASTTYKVVTDTDALESYAVLTADQTELVNMRNIEGTAGTMEREYQMFIDMAQCGLTGYTEEQMLTLARQGYFDGMQGVVNPSVGSVGMNLHDGKYQLGVISTTTGEIGVSTSTYCLPSYARVKGLTNYVMYYGINASFRYFLYDINKEFIGTDTSSGIFTTTKDTRYVRFHSSHFGTYFDVQLQEGSVITDYYTLYEGSRQTAYTTLHSLPNGVKDRWYRDGDNVHRKDKRIAEYTLVGTDVTTIVTGTNVQYTNVQLSALSGVVAQSATLVGEEIIIEGFGTEFDDSIDNADYIGRFDTTDTTIRLIFDLGTYADLATAQADLAGTKIIYELASPIQEKLAVDGKLELLETIYNESDTFNGELNLTYPTNLAGELDSQTKGLQEETDGDWIEPTLLNGWSWFGTVYSTVGYRRDSDGIIHLKGMIGGGTTTDGTDLLTLPSGYNSEATSYRNVVTAGGGVCGIRINNNGLIDINTGAGAWISLDGISFKAEQ